ncbi:MAG: cation:proton antiporter [Ornithinimicrobium sp.]
MTWLPLTLAGVGLTGVVLALVSSPMQRWVPLTEPLLALLLGVLLGPAVLGLIVVPEATRDVLLLEGTRVLLAWSVMAAALRFPARTLRGVVKAVLILLVVVMPISAGLTALSALALGVPWAIALLIGACLAPTDPVLAASVVTGKPAQHSLSARVRATLTIESGANDGLGIVLVGIGIAAVLPERGYLDAVGEVAWELLAAGVVGVTLGLLAGRGLTFARSKGELGRGPELVYTLLLALAVLGVTRLLSADGVLAVFLAGLAYNCVVPGTPREHQVAVDEGINRYAVIPLFALLGIVLPWADWRDLGWPAVVFVLGVVLLRRPGVVLLLAHRLGVGPAQGFFMGWFGPMGVSALFYLAHARDEGVTDPGLFAAVTLAVTASVVVFGLTSSPGRRWYAARLAPASSAGRR